MNKIFLISLFIMSISLLMAPSFAWNPNTHYEIVESNYNSMPYDVQQKLSLEDMEDGADDPDFKFFDFRYHSYPNSIIKADYWLKEGRTHYKMGDYKYASYCFGVASHYISDSFDSPHTANIKGYEHILYEAQASLLTPQGSISASSVMDYSKESKNDYLSNDLNIILSEGYYDGKDNWESWIKTDNKNYIKIQLNRATSASYVLMNRAISQSYFQ